MDPVVDNNTKLMQHIYKSSYSYIFSLTNPNTLNQPCILLWYAHIPVEEVYQDPITIWDTRDPGHTKVPFFWVVLCDHGPLCESGDGQAGDEAAAGGAAAGGAAGSGAAGADARQLRGGAAEASSQVGGGQRGGDHAPQAGDRQALHRAGEGV
eukprot:1195838-Prorocentrum_minimum.AAC.3